LRSRDVREEVVVVVEEEEEERRRKRRDVCVCDVRVYPSRVFI
jgi:hypothetical protein